MFRFLSMMRSCLSGKASETTSETTAKPVNTERHKVIIDTDTGSDDAAAMMNAVKEHGGITTYLGIGTDTTQAVHNDEFDLDEECIPAAIDMCMYALDEIHGM